MFENGNMSLSILKITPKLKLANVYKDFGESRETKCVCKNRSKWKEVISAYPIGKQA
jgi:hypothetical protein